MTTVDIRNSEGSSTGSVTLPAEIFDVQVNVPLLHQVVVAQLAAARQGTHSTKSRGEVSGGGRKPYKQKGTGRARQGSIRAPQFVGGGVVHGPTPRDYDQRTPKKMKAAALRGALSDRARDGRIHVVTSFVEGGVPSTKAAIAVLAGLTTRAHALVVATREDALTFKSLRNLQGVHLLAFDQLNTYDVLVSDDVIFTEDALRAFLDAREVEAEWVEATAKPVAKKAAAKKAAADDAADAADADDAKPVAKKATAKKTTAKPAAAKKTAAAKPAAEKGDDK
jgi:large subunit ribosomal protein L4